MNVKGKHDLTDTPCIGVCSATALGDAVCRGCKRSFDEVRLWNTFTDEQKIAINKRLLKTNCHPRESGDPDSTHRRPRESGDPDLIQPESPPSQG